MNSRMSADGYYFRDQNPHNTTTARVSSAEEDSSAVKVSYLEGDLF